MKKTRFLIQVFVSLVFLFVATAASAQCTQGVDCEDETTGELAGPAAPAVETASSNAAAPAGAPVQKGVADVRISSSCKLETDDEDCEIKL